MPLALCIAGLGNFFTLHQRVVLLCALTITHYHQWIVSGVVFSDAFFCYGDTTTAPFNDWSLHLDMVQVFLYRHYDYRMFPTSLSCTNQNVSIIFIWFLRIRERWNGMFSSVRLGEGFITSKHRLLLWIKYLAGSGKKILLGKQGQDGLPNWEKC